MLTIGLEPTIKRNRFKSVVSTIHQVSQTKEEVFQLNSQDLL
jgi:hypothetical protein